MRFLHGTLQLENQHIKLAYRSKYKIQLEDKQFKSINLSTISAENIYPNR